MLRKTDSEAPGAVDPRRTLDCPARAQESARMSEAQDTGITTSLWCHCTLLGDVMSLNLSKEFSQGQSKYFLALGEKGGYCVVFPILSQISLCCSLCTVWLLVVPRGWEPWVQGVDSPRVTMEQDPTLQQQGVCE